MLFPIVTGVTGQSGLARRNDHAPVELKGLAVEAARSIAIAEGLRGLTVRRVAERIGYAPGTLYNLFTNLDDLIVQLNGDTLRRLAAALSLASGAEPGDRPARLVDAYFDFVEREPLLWSVLFEHRLPQGTSLPAWYTGELDNLVDLVANSLQPVMSEWPAKERRTTVVAMWAALHGISTLAVSNKLALVADLAPRQLGHLVVDRMLAAGPSRS